MAATDLSSTLMLGVTSQIGDHISNQTLYNIFILQLGILGYFYALLFFT